MRQFVRIGPGRVSRRYRALPAVAGDVHAQQPTPGKPRPRSCRERDGRCDPAAPSSAAEVTGGASRRQR